MVYNIRIFMSFVLILFASQIVKIFFKYLNSNEWYFAYIKIKSKDIIPRLAKI